MRLGKTLAARILVGVLGIVVVMMVIAAALVAHQASLLTDEQSVVQARSIAVAVAAMPDVAEAVTGGDTARLMPALAERIRAESQADYVVVIDASGTRYSHPRPDLIGAKIQEPVVALDGQVHTGIDEGDLGRSANVRAPIVDASGRPVGEVSVGILESTVNTRSAQQTSAFLLSGALALALGVAASFLLARTIKRVTFGLEPAEIVALVQEREAMLHGIREGVLGIDARGRVNVLNEEARRLLQLPTAQLGQRIEDAVAPSQLQDILVGRVAGPDRVAVTDEHLLVLNRMPVTVGGRPAGWVVTIRDRTEMEALLRQLDSVTGLTNALRAQEREFSNRLLCSRCSWSWVRPRRRPATAASCGLRPHSWPRTSAAASPRRSLSLCCWPRPRSPPSAASSSSSTRRAGWSTQMSSRARWSPSWPTSSTTRSTRWRTTHARWDGIPGDRSPCGSASRAGMPTCG